MNPTLLIVILGLATSYGYLSEKDYGNKLISLARTWHNKCVPITGVTQAQIEEVKNGNFTGNENIKRYVLCLWFVSDVMGLDYKLNEALLKELMPKKLLEGAATYLECAKQARESDIAEPYEKTWSLIKCTYNKNPLDFIMF